jgi:hypothetical protein
MMRTRRLSSIQFCFVLGSAVFATVPLACSSSHHDAPTVEAEAPDETGTMAVALTARSSSGTLYRLREAAFDVFRTGDVGSGGPPRPPFASPPFDEGVVIGVPSPPVSAGAGGVAGSPTMGTGGIGFGGSNIAGSAGAFIDPFPPVFPSDPFEFFQTTLFSENDPLASTLETTLPTGQYGITLFEGWFLEKVVDGVATPVNARLVSSSLQQFGIEANEETTVVFRFETDGEVLEFGQGRLIVRIEVDERETRGPNARRGVIETSVGALSGFTLRDTLDAALRNSGAAETGLSALDAYHAIVDSYAPAQLARDPDAAHCDDELTGGVPSLNGFPLMCGRLEAEQFANLDAWFPIAAVNRLDLAPADGADCGQQRLIFANNSSIGNGRMFIIVESLVPNPSPECGLDACRPVAEFWSSLTQIDDAAARGQMLRDAFLSQGVGTLAPFVNSDHLGPEGGQIRTNNFNDFVWTLREFHFQAAPEVLPLPKPVSESPNGELWNDLSALPEGQACRESFLAALPGLLGSELSAMSFPVAEACKDAESPNDFFRQDYASHLAGGSGSFVQQIQDAVDGTGLSAFDVAARARFAGSCMGCHQEASGSFLGAGLVAPFSNDFVQVSEFNVEDCGDGSACFGLSNALRDVFVPHRIDVQDRLLSSEPACGGPGGGSTGGAGGTPGAGGGSAGSGTAGTGPVGEAGSANGAAPAPDRPLSNAARTSAPRRTLGGQLVVSHAH